MTNPYIKSIFTFTIFTGVGWALYCMSPAGAAEREQTRHQNDLKRQMYRKEKESQENK